MPKPESTKYQGIPYDFGGGRVLVIPTLSLGAMEKMQDRLTSFREGRVDQEAIAATIDVADVALERIKPLYLRHAKPNPIPEDASPEERLKAINDWVTQFGGGLLLEILIREIQLINLRVEGS